MSKFEFHAARVQKVVRQLLLENPKLRLNDLIDNYEVRFAVENEDYDEASLMSMIMPPMGAERVLESYLPMALWSLDEAASIGVGINPEQFAIEERQFYTEWRGKRTQLKQWTERAIIDGSLASKRQDDIVYVNPTAFVRWANQHRLLDTDMVRHLAVLLEAAQQEAAPPAPVTPPAPTEQLRYQKELSTRQWVYQQAVELKLATPAWKIPELIEHIYNNLAADQRDTSGLTRASIKRSLYELDQPTHFLKSHIPTQEIDNPDPTHRWWHRFRTGFSADLKWLRLPE